MLHSVRGKQGFHTQPVKRITMLQSAYLTFRLWTGPKHHWKVHHAGEQIFLFIRQKEQHNQVKSHCAFTRLTAWPQQAGEAI